MQAVFLFVFLYPLLMSIFWMQGALLFFLRREGGDYRLPQLAKTPRVAVLVPCHNEALCIRDSISYLAENEYPNFEIIAIDDGSTDATGEILAALSGQIAQLRVITLTRNYGKATALKAGAIASQAEFLMCVDADALLDKDALFWMMRHFLEGPRVGAVTGNPRVINRNSLLARLQIGEFSAIIGMIKRTQRNIGRLFTVSGVNACYRRSAVHSVGYWSPETVTEDVDISWKLQLNYWDIRYEPQALTWILVPETFKALFRQRLRWARGGFQAAVKYAGDMAHWRSRRMWLVFLEYWVGVVWCYALLATVLIWFLSQIVFPESWPRVYAIPNLLPGWSGVLLAVVCLLQFVVGLSIDSHYERRGLLRYLYWAIWYPAAYWMINAVTTIIALPSGIYRLGKTRHGVWQSPGRKIKQAPMMARKTAGVDRRHYFHEHNPSASQRLTELSVTALFWGLWAYLVTPLLSLLLWVFGIYLFSDRILAMGGYSIFARDLTTYGLVIGAIAVAMVAWMLWNHWRYGCRCRRIQIPAHIFGSQMGQHMGLLPVIVESLRNSRKIVLGFDNNDQPVLDPHRRSGGGSREGGGMQQLPVASDKEQ